MKFNIKIQSAINYWVLLIFTDYTIVFSAENRELSSNLEL